MPLPASTERGRGAGARAAFRLVAVGIAASVLGCGSPREPEPRSSPGLDAVRRFVGSSPAESRLWDRFPLRGRLERLLGDRLPVLAECLESAGPVGEDGGIVYAFGDVEGRGGLQGAVLLVDPARDVVNVRFRINRAAQDFHEDGVALSTPGPVGAFLRSFNERLYAEPETADSAEPENVDPLERVPSAEPAPAPVRRGYLEIGPDDAVFLPCGSFRRTWVVNAAEAALSQVREDLGVRPYEPFFVELRGRLDVPSPERSKLGYEAEIEIEEILRAGPGGAMEECE